MRRAPLRGSYNDRSLSRLSDSIPLRRCVSDYRPPRITPPLRGTLLAERGAHVATDNDVAVASLQVKVESLMIRVAALESNQRWAVLAVLASVIGALMNLLLKG